MSGNPLAASAVRRSNQVYYEQVAGRETIACGYAYYSSDYPRVAACNFLGEVLLDDDTPNPSALVDEFYADRGLECHRWAPAAGQSPEQVERLLAPDVFERRESIALLFPPNADYRLDARVRVLGARAMRRAYTAIVGQRSAAQPDLADDLTAVQLERLNDPQYDGFVALLDDEPVGICSVFQVGEIGRICDVFVVEKLRRRGVGAAMVSYAVMTARRWSLRPICAEVPADDEPARALFRKLGFEEGGVIVSFRRRTASEVRAS